MLAIGCLLQPAIANRAGAAHEQDEPTRDLAEARSEVLRCIVSVCTAEALLQTPHTYHAVQLPVMASLVELLAPNQGAHHHLSPLALCVFQSLLNTLLAYQVRGMGCVCGQCCLCLDGGHGRFTQRALRHRIPHPTHAACESSWYSVQSDGVCLSEVGRSHDVR